MAYSGIFYDKPRVPAGTQLLHRLYELVKLKHSFDSSAYDNNG